MGYHFLDAVTPKLVLDLVRLRAGADLPTDPTDEELSTAARWEVPINLGITLPALLLVATYGNVSDRWGRKPLFFIHLSLAVVAFVVLSVVAFAEVYVAFVLVGFIIYGLSGSLYVFLLAAFSYSADVSARHSKAKHFGWIEGGIYLGHFGGPFLGGLLYDRVGRWAPYLGTTAAFAACLIYCFFIPESLPPSKRTTKLRLQDATLLSSFKILFETRQRAILTLVFVLAYNTIAIHGILVYYTIQQFSWTTEQVGTFISVTWLYRAMSVIFLIPLFQRMFVPDLWPIMMLIRTSIMLNFSAQIMFALTKTAWTFYVIGVSLAVGVTFVVCIRSVLCNSVGSDQQGAMLSAISSLEISVNLVAHPLYQALFSATAHSFPQAVFLFAATCGFSAFCLSLFLRREAHVYQPPLAGDVAKDIDDAFSINDAGQLQLDASVSLSNGTEGDGAALLRHSDDGLR